MIIKAEKGRLYKYVGLCDKKKFVDLSRVAVELIGPDIGPFRQLNYLYKKKKLTTIEQCMDLLSLDAFYRPRGCYTTDIRSHKYFSGVDHDIKNTYCN